MRISDWSSDVCSSDLKPCYRCFVGADPAREDASCADQGVIGALTGVIGSWGALEALRELVRFGEDAAGRLALFDALTMRVKTLSLPKDPACPACGEIGRAHV